MKRMLSGIKPTGRLTLGNYIGAIRNFVAYQEDYDMYVFIANLHEMCIRDRFHTAFKSCFAKTCSFVIYTYLRFLCKHIINPNVTDRRNIKKIMAFYRKKVKKNQIYIWLFVLHALILVRICFL